MSGGQGPAAQAASEGLLSQALGRLIAVAEAYPDLKANQNFLALQNELTSTEDRIASARRYYNANVRALNTKVESVPSNVVAGMFSIKREEYFEVEGLERETVKVDFGQSNAPIPPPKGYTIPQDSAQLPSPLPSGQPLPGAQPLRRGDAPARRARPRAGAAPPRRPAGSAVPTRLRTYRAAYLRPPAECHHRDGLPTGKGRNHGQICRVLVDQGPRRRSSTRG